MKKSFYYHNMIILAVILGAINCGLTVFNFNLVEYLSNFINDTFNSNYPIDKVIYILIALAGLKLVKRDIFLPFLGKTVVPTTVVPIKENKYKKDKVEINIQPNSKVMYWAAKKMKTEKENVWDAYDDFSNSGVTQSDKNGKAVLLLEKGSGYIVPGGRYVKPHVHYRYEIRPGMFSRIETIYY
jgi:uncharacterized membrane protein YuzA (DUF378 family)